MHRVYRLSKTGAKLPKHYSYGPVRSAADRRPGFEAFKGPIYSVAFTIGAEPWTLTEGDFTPSAGYHQMLLIDVHRFYRHAETADTCWFVILPEDVEAVRSLPVRELHAWLRQHAACVGTNGELSREAVVTWVQYNRASVEAWLDQHSQSEPVEFIETLDERPTGD
jgi:hypothetical protein